MILGLKRGVVELAEHDPEWEIVAAQTIERLWRVFGSVAKDIQHVGSTAIRHIKAKPVIDIAVLVEDFYAVEALESAIENAGFVCRFKLDEDWQRYIVLNGSEIDIRISNIHVVKNEIWNDYINFRDYLNANPRIAKEYEDIKVRLAVENPVDPGRKKYLAGKHDFVAAKINEARIWAEFGKTFTKIEPITKGWSGDKKYYVETADNERLILRIFEISEYDRKKIEYDALCKTAALELYVPQPKGFGVFNDSTRVYYLVTWLDGEDAASVMATMTETERYALGLKAGKLLRKLHTLPAPTEAEPWHIRFGRKIDERLSSYRENNVQSENGERAIKYLTDNAYLLKNRTQTFNHGDFNTTNIIVSPTGEVGAIDFNAFFMTEGPHALSDYGDPLWEMICISYMETPDPHYYTGLWNGYTGGKPDDTFFKITAYYFAYDVLTSLCGGADSGFDNGGFDEKAMRWYDNFTRVVPSWYLGEWASEKE